MTWRAQRALRGSIAAAVATLVALTMHVGAGGATPAPQLVGAVLVFATAAAVLMAGRQLSVARLSVIVGISQLLFHGAFNALGLPTASRQAVAPAPGTHIHDASAQMATAMAANPQLMSGGAHHVMAMDAGMLAAHLVASVLTIVALYHGEALLVRLMRPFVGRILAITWAVARRSAPRLSIVGRAASRHAIELHLATRRRGPPTLVSSIHPIF